MLTSEAVMITERELLALLQATADSTIRDLPRLMFNKQNRSQLYGVCIYSSIVEIAHGAMALIHGNQTTCLPMLIRPMAEAYADLRAWRNNPEHYKTQLAAFVKERLRLLGVGNLQNHPFLGALHEAGDVEAHKAKLEAELQELRHTGHGELSIFQKFERAGMTPEYQSLYWLLCLEGHNDLSTLEDRHLDYEGDEYHVVAFKATRDLTYLAHLDALLVTLIDSSVQAHTAFNSVSAKNYLEFGECLNNIRRRVFG